MDWMTQGPLELSGVLHKMLRHVEKLLTKYDPDKIVKVEDHLDNFYLHMKTLDVCYADVACRLFPCTLDGRDVVWEHNLPPNSIHKSRAFKRIFIKKFFEDKTHVMILKELDTLKMEQKEKVKYFNQSFNHILKKFSDDTKPHDSFTIDYYSFTFLRSIA